MGDLHDEGRGEGFEDVEEALRRNRPEPTPLKLDEMKQTAQARAHRRMGAGGLRQRFVTALLVAGLTLGGGGAVVLAKNGGGDDGKGNGNHGQYCPNDQPKNHDCGKCPPDGKKKGGDDNCGKCPDDAKKKGGDDNCGKDDGHGHGNDGGGDNGKKGKGK